MQVSGVTEASLNDTSELLLPLVKTISLECQIYIASLNKREKICVLGSRFDPCPPCFVGINFSIFVPGNNDSLFSCILS